MADCAPLLDEELSSFVFNYLTENSGSQVRSRPLWTHGTLGFAGRCAAARVAGRGACYTGLMRASRRGSSAASPRHRDPVSRSACVHVCENAYCVLTSGFHVLSEEMSPAVSSEGK